MGGGERWSHCPQLQSSLCLSLAGGTTPRVPAPRATPCSGQVTPFPVLACRASSKVRKGRGAVSVVTAAGRVATCRACPGPRTSMHHDDGPVIDAPRPCSAAWAPHTRECGEHREPDSWVQGPAPVSPVSEWPQTGALCPAAPRAVWRGHNCVCAAGATQGRQSRRPCLWPEVLSPKPAG